MVVIRNDFKEYEEDVNVIAKQYAYVNLSIVKEVENAEIFNRAGEIHIPDKGDKTFFLGALTHEVGHNVNDPITVYNYIKALNEVRKHLDVDDNTLLRFGNVISDILNDYRISRDKVLREFRREYIRKMFEDWYSKANCLQKLLWRFYNRVHGCKLPLKGKDVNKILRVVKSGLTRELKYVELARILIGVLDRDEGKDIGDIPVDLPVKCGKKDLEKCIKRIMRNSRNFDDAYNMVMLLARGLGDKELEGRARAKVLREFYQAKAYICRIGVEYPKRPAYQGVKLGARKWVLSDGFKRLDIKGTMLRFGVNIPTITSRAKRVLPKFISNQTSPKPIDIVVSIDVSGSTGYPMGYMNNVADYEVVMLYALIDEAKRINQKVGLTLWDHFIVYTSLPKCYDYKEVDKLKDIPLSGYWYGGGTRIKVALDQAEKNPDKLFMVFTDGDVYLKELKDVGNAVFFLVKPVEYTYKRFIELYGTNRVIRVRNIMNIPKVTISWFRKVFK